jgi:hypothetical protein
MQTTTDFTTIDTSGPNKGGRWVGDQIIGKIVNCVLTGNNEIIGTTVIAGIINHVLDKRSQQIIHHNPHEWLVA